MRVTPGNEGGLRKEPKVTLGGSDIPTMNVVERFGSSFRRTP